MQYMILFYHKGFQEIECFIAVWEKVFRRQLTKLTKEEKRIEELNLR